MESRLLGFPDAESRSLALQGGSWAREPSCSNTGTINGQYKKNLDELLSNLSKDAPENRVFRTSTVGTGADQVHGSLMCFVDHDQTKCLDCLANTTAWITRTCPSSRTASASYGACLLQYSGPSFIDSAKHSYGFDMNITFMSFSPPFDGDTASMVNARSRLFEEISRRASNQTLGFYNQSRRYTVDKQMMRVYGLAQCRGDLAPGGCSRCISGYNGVLRRLFPNNNGGIVKGHSCYVRFQPSKIGIFAEPMPPSSARRDPFLVLPPPYSPPQGLLLPLPPSYRGQDSRLISMGVIMAIMLAFGMTALLWWGWRKAKACFFPNLIGNLDTGGQEFSYQELVTATNSFSKKLGEGGFGAVFEGKIGDLMVAVKKLSNASESVDGYKAEVTTLSRLNHRNVVPLIGWCHHKRYLLLVYELMPNGSLDTHLHPEKPVLPWIDRYKIAVGLACALAYIHEDSNDRRLVIHKDIKPKNIMIDESFNAKLGDFGLARFVNHGQSAELEPLAGTFGYMDPYSYGIKSDMFSFGVVLLVMGSGRPAIKVVKDDHGTVLESTHIKDIVSGEYGSGGAKAVSDLRLEGNFVPEQMNAMIRVGLLCVSSDSKERPSAKEVFKWLDSPMSPENIPSPRNGGSVSGFPFTINIDGAWSVVTDSSEGAMSSPLLDFPSRAVIQDSNSDRSTAALNNFGSSSAMQNLTEMISGAMGQGGLSHGIEKRKLEKKDSIEGTISSPLLDPPSRAVIHDPKSDRSPAALNYGGSSSVPSGELPIAQQKLVEIAHLFTGGATGQEDFGSVYKTKIGELINIFNDKKMLEKED